jgi:hypothetical protein
MVSEGLKGKALAIIKNFIHVKWGNVMMLKKFKYMLKQIMMLQFRIRDKIKIKFSKVDILINFWDKMIDELVHKSEKFGDNQMIDIINKIILVPQEVRIYVLRAYLKQCIMFYNLAFCQWRLMFEFKCAIHHYDHVKHDEAKELIGSGIE